MKRFIFLLVAMLTTMGLDVQAQRVTDKLDRGLVAVPKGSGSFVSWRIFGEEYYDTEYNLYRNGVKVNSKPLKVSNYTDAGGSAGSMYQVAPVVRGVEQEKCEAVERLSQQYIQFAVAPVTDRNGEDMTADCNINDIALADLTGDGVSEFIMKRNYGADNDASGVYPYSNKTRYNHIEVYNIKGDRLWWIDLGPNMVSGPDEQYDAVGFDWDQDGKAEVLMRGADNMIIHHPDGSTTEIGNMSVNTRNDVRHDDANGAYTHTGAEYLLYLEGATGKPYDIGPNGQKWMTYPLARLESGESSLETAWGDGYGHRSTKHYFGAPYLDGRKPFIFLGRGCYTRHKFKAFSVDPDTHQLTLYWQWYNNNGWSDPWFGNGYHNFGIADVDWDGRDEIVFGSMVIDDNGKGLSTTGLGHGDAQHCSDFDPYRHGQEIFACNEEEPAMNYRDATTSKIYYRLQSTGDDGRALCGNFTNDIPGAVGHSTQTGTVSCVADKVIPNAPGGFTNNFRIYWDGDLLEEGLDGASSREGAARVFKGDGTIVFTADGTANCNWTKNTPSAQGDILGDWREEIVARTEDNKYVRIYTTNIPTNYRNYTLWHDHQYRQGMVWESIGYNQPPHASYYLGELEGITIAPPPFTMTGRTEVTNNGTIGSSLNDKHVIICETGDTKIDVAAGATPYMVTFNVPSWIQGTNSSVTSGNPKIDRTYFTCEVTGSAFTGGMRLVKQGDGILNLPKVEQTYTGETNVWAGTVNFDGTLLHSSLWLNRFAELNSDGGKFRSVKMDYDSRLRPGRADNCGDITTDSLLLGFGSRVVFDLYSDFSADRILTKLMTIETKSWQYGPTYLTPVFEFVYHGNNEINVGRYLLGEVETLKGSLENIKLIGLNTTQRNRLSIEDGKLYLDISNLRAATDIFWTGKENSTWRVDSEMNFANSSGDEQAFVTGDHITFDDNASAFTVTIPDEVEAKEITVDNTKNYTFNGNGSIVGKTKLVKQGTGMLTINTENTYTGGNHITSGVVAVSSLANVNQAKGNLGGVTTSADLFVIENGAELRTTAAVTNGSTINFVGDAGGVINNTNDFIVDRAMIGTNLTKKGSGWMKLNTSNVSLERLIITAGTVQCINAAVPAKTVEFQGGTLNENTSTGYNIHVPANKRGTWNLIERGTFTNKITGQGTLTVYSPVVVGSGWAATRTQIAVNLSDFEGTLICSVSSSDNRFTFDTSSGMPKGTLNISDKIVVQNSAKTFRIGKLLGTGTLGGVADFGKGNSGANTWQIGNDDTWTNTVKITGNSNFVKVGSGKVAWNVANDNTGSTSISEGELSINKNSCLGTGALTVRAGAGLMGSNDANSALKNSSVTINGTLRPGSYYGATSGVIYFGNKPVTFGADAILELGASTAYSSTVNGCSYITGISNLTFNGTIRIIPSARNNLQAGDIIRLWTDVTKFSGTPKIEGLHGIEWDDSRISEGLLIVKSVDTAIRSIVSEKHPHNIYDATGRLVRSMATTIEGLAPGLYVSNGRKFIVR